MDSAGAKTATWPAATSKPAGRFDSISIAFHWLTALLLVSQLATAWLLEQAPGNAANILALHRAVGVLVWIVVALRLVWRKTFARLPPFPAVMPKLQQRAATVNEYALYTVLLAQPLTGLGQTIFRGQPFHLAFLPIPALAAAHLPLVAACRTLHDWGATALLALCALHIGAALFHAVILRDGVFQRMLP
jgi:cytochrome b561